MSQDWNTTQTTVHAGGAVDLGLQSFMRGVYNTMGLGLAVTGLTAFGIANTPVLFNAIFGTPLAWVAMFAPLAFIFLGFTPGRVMRMSSQQLKTTFLIFSAVMGISMAAIFQVFTGASIARVFFITSAAFAATSLYGYTTKRDLTAMGSFLFMGLIGIVIASIVNIFLGSALVQFIVSVIGVVVFTGLTAWETQNLKQIYAHEGGEANTKAGIMGALSLYLNFVNLFQILMQFMGERK